MSYTLSMLGRAQLLCGDLDGAATALDESLELARRENWVAFTPWPESLRADVDLATGECASWSRAATRIAPGWGILPR